MTEPDPDRWLPDVLGAGYEQLTLGLGDDVDGPAVATLVRHRGHHLLGGEAQGADVLYIHGWSDYFFQRPLAEYWAARGARFFALDLRDYGRSIRPGRLPGYITDLATYDEDIEAALSAMGHGSDQDSRRPLILMGHSTGGLILSLWAVRNPGRADALVLNSPWLEFQGHAFGRVAIGPLLAAISRQHPRDLLPAADLGFYTRTVSRSGGGEWDYNLDWRPPRGFRATVGWLRAVLAGHAAVATGLRLTIPVFVWLSARSLLQASWSEGMRAADIVLDVDVVAARSVRLGSSVTVERIEDSLHDVMLSPAPVRNAALDRLTHWLRAALPPHPR